MTEKPVVEPVFNESGWESHKMAQRQRYARMDLADKISWLEEAQRMLMLMEQTRSAVHDRVAEYDPQD